MERGSTLRNMKPHPGIAALLITLILFSGFNKAYAQQYISGTVYDSTAFVPLAYVQVNTGAGACTVTDSNGRYRIAALPGDSLTFSYNGKATLKYAVAAVSNPAAFDIALHVRVKRKYTMLREVRVFSRNYRFDSLENRERFSEIFNYSRGGVKTSLDPVSGVAGVDINELLNLFRFRRNRQLARMRDRLIAEEEEKYVNYRFNKATVRRVTGLEEKELDIFMKMYRPDYTFTRNSSLVDFYRYILEASYDYRKTVRPPVAPKNAIH